MFMDEALKMALKSYNLKEIPVGAVLVKNGKIISKGYNKRERKNKVISHAEINCILKASRKLKTWKLDNCDIYVTLKPCSMCESVIKQSRIRNVYYLIDKDINKKEYYRTLVKKYDDLNLEKLYKEKMNLFFRKRR